MSGNSLFQAALTSFYADVIDQLQLEVNPGAEFAATAQEAKKIMSTIYLGDRDVSITLRRAWHSLSWWQRIKLLYGFCTAVRIFYATSFTYLSKDVSDEDIEKLKENDVMTVGVISLATFIDHAIAIDQRSWRGEAPLSSH